VKKIFFIIFLVYLNTNLFSKSPLPECKGSKIKEYNNCFKTGKYSNGDRYEGEFVNGKFHGKGIYISYTGAKYEGDFRLGKYDGYGVINFPDGSKHSGEWKNGNRHGKGTLLLKDGSRFEGVWANDVRNGKGIFFYSNGTKENVEFKEGVEIDKLGNKKIIEIKTINYSNGDKYEGPVYDGRKNGRGVYYFKNGDKISGNFSGDRLNGRTNYYYKNGDTREGEMLDGKLNGGAFFVTKDKDQYKEIWKDGDLVSREIVKKSNELNRFQKILKAIGL
jgi:hypothetical protein